MKLEQQGTGDSAMASSKPARNSFTRRKAVALLLPLCLGHLPLQAQDLTDLERVRASGSLKVAVYKNNAPFSDGPASDMHGLDVDLATALARQLNLKLALLPFDADENMGDDLRNMVWKGHYLGFGPADVMLQVPADKYLMQENPQVVVLNPYMRQQLVLVSDTEKVKEVSTPEDLKGLPVGGERGAGAISALMGYNGGLLRNQVSIFETGMQAVQAVLDGKMAAAYVTRAQAESTLFQAKAKPGQYRLTSLNVYGIPANGWAVGMAVKSSNKELGQALQTAMQTLRSNGELLAIFKKNGLTLTAP
jgi:polar amino acid transport system substrate-binding protein